MLSFLQGMLQFIFTENPTRFHPIGVLSIFFFHESWKSEHLQTNMIKTSRDVSRKLKADCGAAPEAENTIWTDKQPSGFIDPKSQINSNRRPETGLYTQMLRHLVVPELKRFHPAAEEISLFCCSKNNNGQDISPFSSTPLCSTPHICQGGIVMARNTRSPLCTKFLLPHSANCHPFSCVSDRMCWTSGPQQRPHFNFLKFSIVLG